MADVGRAQYRMHLDLVVYAPTQLRHPLALTPDYPHRIELGPCKLCDIDLLRPQVSMRERRRRGTPTLDILYVRPFPPVLMGMIMSLSSRLVDGRRACSYTRALMLSMGNRRGGRGWQGRLERCSIMGATR